MTKKNTEGARWTVKGNFRNLEGETFSIEEAVPLLNRRHYARFTPQGFKNEFLIRLPDGREVWVYSIDLKEVKKS